MHVHPLHSLKLLRALTSVKRLIRFDDLENQLYVSFTKNSMTEVKFDTEFLAAKFRLWQTHGINISSDCSSLSLVNTELFLPTITEAPSVPMPKQKYTLQ